MCRYTKTAYACGHSIGKSTPTSGSCHDIPCPPVKVTLTSVNECHRCARHTNVKHRKASAKTGYIEYRREEIASDFNPFFGQGGQADEQTYRHNALLAYRRRRDIEWEGRGSSKEYQDLGYDPRTREIERGQGIHVEGRKRELDGEYCESEGQ